MKQSPRTLKKWRNDTPGKHRSYAEKRGRSGKHIEEEVREMLREDRRYDKAYGK